MEAVFGIDLGTTNSCIATIGEDGLPQVIKNLDDEFTTPSVVFYAEGGENYVGKVAKSDISEKVDRSVAFIKREMSNENYSRTIDGKKISPVDVSALILKKVVDDANEQRSYEGLPPIHKAVITVPAYFGNMERELTIQAGKIAGLEVLDLLNEPTAAALSYGTKGLEGKTFMIYDLGGGTFDVSIMRMKNGVLDTLATNGIRKCGGMDWDKKLLDYVFIKNGLDVRYNDIKEERESGKMLLAAENCKKNLSKSEKTSCMLIYKCKPYITEISRGEFEEATSEWLEKTIDTIHQAITGAKKPIEKIDEIILVGGSSYMPMVKNRLQREFSCPIRLDNLEPDRAVAKGAALHAAKLAGKTSPKVVIGTDLASRSYGIGTYIDNVYRVMNVVKRTDDLVYQNKTQLFTRNENQYAVDLPVYENISEKESVDENKCTLIERKTLSWGFPVPVETQIDVYVSRSSDGTVKIWCECQGKRVDFIIKYKGMYSEQEIENMRKELESKRV